MLEKLPTRYLFIRSFDQFGALRKKKMSRISEFVQTLLQN
jgi:hypothetical protein